MGWGSGSSVANDIWFHIIEAAYGNAKYTKEVIALKLVELFEAHDCDTMMECTFVQELLVYDEDKGKWIIK